MKALITSILACFLLAIGAYFFTGLTSGQTGKSEDREDEPTLIQRGQFTEKQREYGKEFKKHHPSFHGRKIDELIRFAKEKRTQRGSRRIYWSSVNPYCRGSEGAYSIKLFVRIIV